METIGLAVCLTVIILLLRCRKPDIAPAKRRLPVFFYTVLYADAKGTGAKLLKSERLGLTGKPDYILKKRTGALLPAELKSGAAGKAPHPGDVMQLGAYFLLIEDAYGRRPKKGLLIYSDRAFFVFNTPRLRKRVADTMLEMRRVTEGGHIPDAAPAYALCARCLCRGVCRAAPR